jgi:4-amino-4-deoxychorismate lyase
MPLFIESVKLIDGVFYRLALHQSRVNKVFAEYFPNDKVINLEEIFYNSDFPKEGKYKCRSVFDKNIQQFEIVEYQIRSIKNLRLVETFAKSFPYKIEDRTAINEAFAMRGTCDDVLLIREGFLTDTSYANIALFDGNKWFTPETPLVYGVNRAQLLSEGLIHEKQIKLSELQNYTGIRLFNAMIEFGEIEIGVEHCFE